MNIRGTIRRRMLVILALSTSLCGSVLAQDEVTFPSGPVKIVVPFPPGGATDTLARQMAEYLAKKWDQSVIVENKPGGNTMLGTSVVAKAPADGHTLGIVTGSHVINPLLTSKMPYDTLKDLTGVMLLTRYHMALYAHPSFPADSIEELVALARKEPGGISYAYATTQTFLAMELFNSMAGTRMQNVPYKGSAQALTDLVGGHIGLLVDPVLQSSVEFARTGKLKVIGTLGTTHSPLAPDVSLPADTVPGFEFSGVFGLVARAGTSPTLVHRIRDDFAAVMQLPKVAERIRDIGQEPIASTPEEYNAYILSEMKKWAPVVEATGAKLY